MTALNGFKLGVDLVQKIIKDYTHTFTHSGKTIIFCWTASHVNIPGNERDERAYAAARSVLSLLITNIKTLGV